MWLQVLRFFIRQYCANIFLKANRCFYGKDHSLFISTISQLLAALTQSNSKTIISRSKYMISMIDNNSITYSHNEELAYDKNITEKITKLENQIKRWLWRGLSLKGKINICQAEVFPPWNGENTVVRVALKD